LSPALPVVFFFFVVVYSCTIKGERSLCVANKLICNVPTVPVKSGSCGGVVIDRREKKQAEKESRCSCLVEKGGNEAID
jgi:hypothetical protein